MKTKDALSPQVLRGKDAYFCQLITKTAVFRMLILSNY
jgi:hypothetical protein